MKTWVLKIGTSILRGSSKHSANEVICKFSKTISKAKNKGDQIIIVSSGAVGLGCLRLGLDQRPTEISALQAIAAIGQGYLMSLYQEYMNLCGFNVAQILLTRSDFNSRKSYNNASMTLKKLLEWNVIPIVNENDSISDEELKYGDNDTLSALVATSVSANELVLLTDIDKLYSSDPNLDTEATPIIDVHNTKELISSTASASSNSNWGTGGVITKLSAARIATECGIKVHLADGRDPYVLEQILNGDRGGTVFHPQSKRVKSRKSWLAHALHPQGSLYIDLGATNAIKNKGASLLLVGIIKIEGSFQSNQPVKIFDSEGTEFARGISSLSSEYIFNILETDSSFQKSPIVIHRDVLVLLS